MNSRFTRKILKACGATHINSCDEIQTLWSGYGHIYRVELEGGPVNSTVVKQIKFPSTKNHPRGWNTGLSHTRKVKSYKVEMLWYDRWAQSCNKGCIVPRCFGMDTYQDEILLILEDLDEAGYPKRRQGANREEIHACINWLANFHATFLQKNPEGLWKKGTYWHLDTRPDELQSLKDLSLKKAAGKIDNLLQKATYKTIVHGDAKIANFCFSPDGTGVAAVDFQYVGGGCGMKDLAYFVGSCLREDECEAFEGDILRHYFTALRSTLDEKDGTVNCDELEHEWRSLYHPAWADFHRFLKGWSPGHWKLNSYSERVTRKVIESLG